MFEQTHRYIGSNVDRAQAPAADQAKEKAEFISRFSAFLQPIELDILVLKYVYNEVFSDIAKELKLIGVETVIRIHDSALKKLKVSLHEKN